MTVNFTLFLCEALWALTSRWYANSVAGRVHIVIVAPVSPPPAPPDEPEESSSPPPPPHAVTINDMATAIEAARSRRSGTPVTGSSPQQWARTAGSPCPGISRSVPAIRYVDKSQLRPRDHGLHTVAALWQ